MSKPMLPGRAEKRAIAAFAFLLLLYTAAVFLNRSEWFQGDEGRYLDHAEAMARGTYFSGGEVRLWSGPGYPLFLLPFILLKLPLSLARLANVLFILGAVFYFWKTLRLYVSEKQALAVSLLLGIWPPFLRDIHRLLTESLASFLLCAFIFYYSRSSERENTGRRDVLAASFFLAVLALTKIFFGYVLLACLFLFFIRYLLRKRRSGGQSLIVLVLALGLCLPYLAFTYARAGKAFYWGTSGGMSLYWMSVREPGEWGSWHSWEEVRKNPLLAPHRSFFETLQGLNAVRQDEAFRRKALDNISRDPRPYFINWAANVGRLFFSYPYSHASQGLSTYFFILPNMFLSVLLVLSLYPGFLLRRRIPPGIIDLTLIGVLSLLGTSLLSAYPRQLSLLLPFIFLWLAIVYFKFLKIEPRPEAEETR